MLREGDAKRWRGERGRLRAGGREEGRMVLCDAGVSAEHQGTGAPHPPAAAWTPDPG